MLEKAMRVTLVCGLGAYLGSHIVLSLSPHYYLSWVGVVVGALTGYLLVEFKTVITAVKTAWVDAWRKVSGLEFNRKKWRRGFWNAAPHVVGNVGFYFLAWVISVALSTTGAVREGALGYGFLLALPTLLTALFTTIFSEERVRRGAHMGMRKVAFQQCLWVNPVTLVTFWPLYTVWVVAKLTLKGMVLVPWAVGQAGVFVAEFISRTFILIHSDLRLLCLVDAGFGTIIGGYGFRNALMGMLVGAILGFPNFYFVSVKWLKLFPANVNVKV